MQMNSEYSPDMPSSSSTSLALLVIPPLQANKDHAISLEATMQSLVLDRRHPIALELAGTTERRSFIVRATSQASLDNVEVLLRAQYPQIEIRKLRENEDPFRLEPQEAVTAVELQAGAAAYLPLRSWKESLADGNDPLLSLLAALGRLPDNTRVIAQLGLVPAADNWSRWNLRRAIESPLAPEQRAKDAQRMVSLFNDEFSTTLFANIGLLAIFVFVARPLLPGWVLGALMDLVTGKGGLVSQAERTQLLIYAGVLVLLEVIIYLFSVFLRVQMRNRAMYDAKVVAQKVSRLAYRTRLRLYIIGPKSTKHQSAMLDRFADERAQAQVREDLMLRMIAAYRQFHMANGAFFVPRRIFRGTAERLLSPGVGRPGYGWQQGLRQSRHMVSVDALATLWHMPDPGSLPELALVEHRRSRTLLIPPAVSKQCQGLAPIGYSEHAGYRLPFGLNPEFFTFHTLLAGKVGEGKSTFTQHIAYEAMRLGGLVLIDPFGDLCENVLQLVPPHRIEDVVFIDLSDKNSSVGLNPLDVTLGSYRDKFIADLLKMLSRIWVQSGGAASWNPKMENAFEMSLRTLFEANKVLVSQDPQRGVSQQYTLLDVLPLLTNANFCHALLQQIEDDYLHRWWREYYEPLSLVQQRDVINPIAAGVAKFESIIPRRILGQSASTLNFAQMITDRKIILIKLAKGIIGSEVASMIGAMLLGIIQITLEEQGQGRPGTVEAPRLPIILDEFQRVAGADYRLLSEMHKYGATFFLSTQSMEYLQKLNPLIFPTIQANVRQMVTFNMAAHDAALMNKEMGVDQEDILHLDINTCYVSIPSAGRRQPTFSLKLIPPTPGDPVQAESIRTRCRIRYTTAVSEVDEQLREAMLRSIRLAPRNNLPEQASTPTFPSRDPLPAPLVTASSAPERTNDPNVPTIPLDERVLEGADYRARRARLAADEDLLKYQPHEERLSPEASQEASREGAEYRARRERLAAKEDMREDTDNYARSERRDTSSGGATARTARERPGASETNNVDVTARAPRERLDAQSPARQDVEKQVRRERLAAKESAPQQAPYREPIAQRARPERAKAPAQKAAFDPYNVVSHDLREELEELELREINMINEQNTLNAMHHSPIFSDEDGFEEPEEIPNRY